MLTFDRQFARLLLEICRYTYSVAFSDKEDKGDLQDSLDEILKYGTPNGNAPTALKGSTTSVACVTSYPDKNIVSYMGTKTKFDTKDNAIASLQDWLKNFSAAPVKFKLSHDQLGKDHPQDIDVDNLGGLVHEGFLEELSAVQDQVVETLLSRGGRGCPVYITGHSQGGAEAALAIRALLAGGFPVVATYTFAAPRAGDIDFKKSIPATLPIHRIEFGDDIVPHVPPKLVGELSKSIVSGLASLPILSDDAKDLLTFIQTQAIHGYTGLGSLCYGSNKTQSLRVDLSPENEGSLFYDRLWSLVRHPDRWAEHHHLAGTSDEVKNGKKGNYTALVSVFPISN
jgi:Lipase (class 3)